MTGFLYRYRLVIIIVAMVLSIAGALLIPSAKTDPDIRNYIPATMTSRMNTDEIEKNFGVQDIIMILLRDSMVITAENLQRISSITDELSGLRGVKEVLSVSNALRISGEDGFMMVEPAVPFLPSDSTEARVLESELRDNPLIMGSVISDDFTAASIVVYLDGNVPEMETLAKIDSLVSAYQGRAELLIGGLPAIRRAILKDVRRDGLILVPLALTLMLLLLWISFREIRGVILPFSVVLLSMALAMGLAPLFGWKLSILSLLVPVMMIAIANNYGIHLIARYQEINHCDRSYSVRQILEKLLRSLRQPVIFTGLTTIAGILGLLTHSVIPARQVGVLAAIGVGYALLLSLFFIPAWMSYLPKPTARSVNGNGASPDGSAGYLTFLARVVTNNPFRVLVISSLVTLLIGSGIFFLKIESNQENFFPAGHPVKAASEAINDGFGGSQNISVMVEADILDPANMLAIDEWCSRVKDEPGVGNVMSVARVVREMSKALFDAGESYYDTIPDTREALAQMVEIYNMSGDPEDFEQLVDLNYTRAHVMVRFNDPAARNIDNIVSMADELEDKISGRIVTGGYAYIMEEFSGRILRGQISSIIFALLVIFVLLSGIFRSLRGGLIGTIPMLASIAILLGFMGWAGIAIDPATALLSSIMIGVGVDYTIHYIWRHMAEMERGLGTVEAAARAISTTGRGIVFNALSVMAGFSVLVFSGFTSIRFFGYLVIISIGVCLVAALVTVPAIMILFRPRFAANDSLIKK